MYDLNVLFVAVFLIFLPKSLEAPEQKEEVEERIINGYDCDPKEIPFIVSIVSQILCGGSLITWRWVLTAAHCLHSEDIQGPGVTTKIRSGYTAPPNFIQERVMVRAVVHSKYDRRLMAAAVDIRYDLGLIMVNEPFQPSPYTQIAKLPTPGFSERCTYGLAAGIGKTHHEETIIGNYINARPLKCVQLKIVDPYTFCQKTFPKATIDDSMICTKEPSKDTCVGDSGGPLICDNVLIGTVSFGPIECGISPGSASFMKVEKFLDFIEATIHPNVPKNGRRSRPIKSSARKINPSVSKLKLLFLTVFYCFALVW